MLPSPLRPIARSLALPAAALAVHAQFATEVISYTPGTGIATEFGTGLPYDQTSAVLGEPSRLTPGQFGGPVDPLAPPYTRDQLLSVGAGGSLTVKFSAPVGNDPLHPFGIDFQIFGSAGFIVTNDFDADFNYIGTPATDGSLFGAQDGETRVSVSADGQNFFLLDPAQARPVDGLFPTDGQGDFTRPLDPAFSGLTFSGKTLAEIRALYAGSGGGIGYDLAWAQDGNGTPANLSSISYVRIEVLTGKSEIDALSAVAAVPEPELIGLLVTGAGALACLWRRRREPAVG